MCICIDGMGDPRWGTLGPSGHSVGKTFLCMDGMGDPRWGKLPRQKYVRPVGSG